MPSLQMVSGAPTPSRLSMLAEGLGKSIARGFPAPEQIAQRKLLSEALDKVGVLAKNPQASPIDLTLETLKAGAGIPGFERYAIPLMEKLTNMSAYQNPINQGDQPQSGPTPQAMAGGQPPSNMLPQGIQTQSMPNEEMQGASGIQLGQFIPMDIGNYIGPDQAQNIINQTGSKGGDPNLAKQRIRDYNEGLITYNELLNSNVDRQYGQVQRQLQQEQKVKSFIDEQLSKDIPEARKNIYYKMMNKELRTSPDFTTAYQKVSPAIQAFEKRVKELPSKIPEADRLGMNQQQKKLQRQITKNMMDVDPLAYPILEEMYKQKGHPITEIADTLNPLPQNIKAITNQAGDYKEYLFPTRATSEAATAKMLDVAMKKQQEEIPKLAKQIAKNWDENISFTNMYTELKKKGWFPQNIQNLFEELKKLGLKLGEQQETDIVQLGTPPPIPFYRLSE